EARMLRCRGHEETSNTGVRAYGEAPMLPPTAPQAPGACGQGEPRRGRGPQVWADPCRGRQQIGGAPMLTEREVVPYLLQKQLVSTASLVDGDLTVIDASRRNRTWHVVCTRGPGYVLKQGVDPASRATVAREAAIYQYLQAQAHTTGLTRFLPRAYGYD